MTSMKTTPKRQTTYQAKPCLTLRQNTERPIAIEVGKNTLLGEDPAKIRPHVEQINEGKYRTGCIPELWDVNTAVRIKRLITDMTLCNQY